MEEASTNAKHKRLRAFVTFFRLVRNPHVTKENEDEHFTDRKSEDDGVLRRVLLDVFKAYNEQQKDVELRVVIPEE